MTDTKDTKIKKKTLSLKLGSKPLITPKRNIEAGKTVIVEKKRYKKGINTEPQSQTLSTNKQNTTEKISIEINENSQKKSGVLLKPLSKDEQKRILKADSKKEKKDEIDKIRSGKSPNQSDKQDPSPVEKTNININNLDNRDLRRDSDKKKNSEKLNETEDRKKTQIHLAERKLEREKSLLLRL